MRLAITTALAAFVLALVAIGTAHAATTFRHCGDLKTGPQDIRALHVRCKAARNLARAHRGTCDLRNRTCYVGDYHCTRKFFGNSGTRVRCTNDAAVVKFFYGI